jgi:hypothetical protein
VAPRLADLVRRARRLAAERDRLLDGLAVEWARALRGQNFSASDLDELWAGLTEDAVRRGGRSSEVADGGAVTTHAWHREAQEVIARLREKVEARLDGR